LGGGAAVAVAGVGAVTSSAIGMGSSSEYKSAVADKRVALPLRPELKDYIRFATLAANSHNTQAWTFNIGNNRIVLSPDFSRRTAIVDPDDHHLFVSLGCAAENLSLAAAAGGNPGELSFDPSGIGTLGFDFVTGTAGSSSLFGAITQRQSTRAEYDARKVSAADLAMLSGAATVPGVDVVFMTEQIQIERLRDIVVAANGVQMMDTSYVRELKSWLRFNPRQALLSGDGLYTAATGNSNLPTWLGPKIFDWFVSAKSESDKYAKQMASSSGVAIFVSQREDREHWTKVGQACQRFALQAAALGIKCAFMNQPIEVAKFRPELAALVSLPGRRPDILMRFGYGPALPYSARRSVEAVIV
jgi:hypothetical protein